MRKMTFIAAAAATLLAACSQQGPTDSAPAAASTGGAPASGTPVVGLALSTQNNPFFVELKDGAEKAAKDAGVQLVVVDAQLLQEFRVAHPFPFPCRSAWACHASRRGYGDGASLADAPHAK